MQRWLYFIAVCLIPWTAQAADYALLMGVGNYQRPHANLPGIDQDLILARRIALSLGVPEAQIREMRDSQVTLQGMKDALQQLDDRVSTGDRVFIYYTGHGSQRRGTQPQPCMEGMFVHDMRFYADEELEKVLKNLSRKVGQLIMFNDSCFSGGAASTGRTRSMSAAVPKFYKEEVDSTYVCGRAVNMRRNLRSVLDQAGAVGSNVVYVAASRVDQVAFATPQGSVATLAWAQCLGDEKADSNGSGSLDVKELRRCAQHYIDQLGLEQSIAIEGNPDLPLSFAAASAMEPTPEEAAQRSAATLEDIRQAASPAIQVVLQANPILRINQDPLDLRVRSNRDGYLYVLQVGSDGQTFNLLFPNQLDQHNRIQADQTLQLPRAHWRIRAGGPPGQSHVLAIVAEQPRDFLAGADASGPFRSAALAVRVQRTLRIEASGLANAPSPGHYGASAVLAISEVFP